MDEINDILGELVDVLKRHLPKRRRNWLEMANYLVLHAEAEKEAAKAKLGKVKPRPRPEERSGNSKGGMIDYRKTGLFR